MPRSWNNPASLKTSFSSRRWDQSGMHTSVFLIMNGCGLRHRPIGYRSWRAPFKFETYWLTECRLWLHRLRDRAPTGTWQLSGSYVAGSRSTSTLPSSTRALLRTSDRAPEGARQPPGSYPAGQTQHIHFAEGHASSAADLKLEVELRAHGST